MASVRLTESIRSRILEAVLLHAFAKEDRELLVAEHMLARQVYDMNYSKEQQKRMYDMEPGFLHTRDGVHFYVDGEYHQLNYGEDLRTCLNEDSQRFGGADAFAKLFRAYQKRKEKFNERRTEARLNAVRTLGSVTTLQKLIEVWPAIEPFTKDIQPKEKPVVALAVPIRSLNRMLDLPVKEVAAE